MSDDKKSGKRPRQHRQSSRSYKSDLEKLFESDGKVPDRFQEVMKSLEPEEGSPEAERAAALEVLRQTEGFREFVKATNAYRRQGYELPEDENLLTRMLDHPRETVISEVLTGLIDLQRRGALKGSATLKARLKTVKTVRDDPSIHELADELSQKL